jgi:hypothetical protein
MIILPALLYLALNWIYKLSTTPEDAKSELKDDFFILRIGRRLIMIPRSMTVFLYHIVLLLNVLIMNVIVINFLELYVHTLSPYLAYPPLPACASAHLRNYLNTKIVSPLTI